MAAVKESLTFRDAKGNTVRTSFFVVDVDPATNNTAASAIIVPLEALSNAHLQSATGPTTAPPTEVVYGTNATFASVEDKAIFTFQTASGKDVRYQIPAPLAAIFSADGETVNTANALVVAYVAAVIANACTADGELVAFGANGTRIRRKLHRRFNIFTKNPALTGPGE